MKKYSLIILLFSFIYLTENAFPSNHLGGNIHAEHLGGNDYMLSLVLYFDCGAIMMPGSLNVQCSSSVSNFSVALPFHSAILIAPVCDTAATICYGGSIWAYKKAIFKQTVTLVPGAWTISYSSCCRPSVNNIQNPTNTELYIYTHFNSLLAPGNHLPVFLTEPLCLVPIGQETHYNHGFFDTDGDSVCCKLVAPLEAYNDPVIYQIGYNPLQFISSNPIISENQITGDLVVTPSIAMKGFYSVELSEYKNISGTPTLVSRTIRELYLHSYYADTLNTPLLAGINPLATSYNPTNSIYYTTLMAGDTMDFSVFPHSPLGTSLILSYPKQINGAQHSIIQNYTPQCIGHFHWVPTSTQIVKGPACFLADIRELSCSGVTPFYQSQIYSYCFHVTGLMIYLTPNPDTSLLLGQTYSLSAYCPGADVYKWYVNGNLVQNSTDSVYQFNTTDLGPGDHTVGCIAAPSSKADLQGFDFVNIHVENNLSLNKNYPEVFKLHPNPSNGNFTLENNFLQGKIHIEIFTLHGSLVYSEIWTSQIPSNKEINANHLPKGLYLIKFSNDSLSITEKIIIH